MKNMMVGALALLVPGMSFAATSGCPDLTGKYDCALTYILTFHRNVDVTQKLVNGVTVYSLRMEQEDSSGPTDIVVDGKNHKAGALPDIMAKYVSDVNYTASCDGQGVRFAGNGILNRNGERADVTGSLVKQSPTEAHLDIGFTSPSKSMQLPAACTKL